MFATAAYLHNLRLLCILTILAAVLAIFGGPTITRRMSTLLIFLISHNAACLPCDRLIQFQC